jgi:iron complex outermembrane recepter protein
MRALPAILRSISLGTSLLAITAAMPASAQDAEKPQDDDFHEDTGIVVTAPYLERLDLLAGTSAMSGEQLSEKARGQIGDILTSLPGVSATSFSPGASRPVLRGYQGNRIAILTNGIGNIDASSTSTDHAVAMDSLTTERIEVLRGPAVLLFGGQAVGGAINVIDKRIPRAVPEEHIHVDALLGYGTAANEYSGGVSADIKLDERFVVHVDGSYRNSDDLRSGGFVLSPGLRADALVFAEEEREEGNIEEAEETERLASLRGDIPNSAVETWTAGTGFAFIDTGGSLGISFNVYDTNYGVPARPGASHGGEEGGEEEGEAPVSIDLRQYRFDLSGSVSFGSGFFDKLNIRAGFADYTHTEFEGDEVGTLFNSEAIESRAELVQADKNGWKGASGVQYQTRNFEAIGQKPSCRHSRPGNWACSRYKNSNLVMSN